MLFVLIMQIIDLTFTAELSDTILIHLLHRE